MRSIIESDGLRQSGFESTTLRRVTTTNDLPHAAVAVAAPTPPQPQLTVYFDGACPVCSREIAHYQRHAGAQACQWVDAAHCPPDALGPGLAHDQALGRFHVRLPDGRLLDGAAGFAALWRVMPGWRWLGWLAQTAPVRPLAALAYSVFLRLRPLWRPAASR